MLLFALVAGPALRVGAQSAGLPTDLELERAFPSLTFQRPVFLTHAGDDSGSLFVVQQAGEIDVFPNDQAVQRAETFLDISQKVSTAGNEEGLLGLAFDPQFADNGHFYVYYSAANPRRSVLSRFSVDASGAVADPTSELVLLEVPQPFSNHNGGMISFGPDGFLYVALGDGGSGGDPQGNGQNPQTLLGSILRIDVAGATAGQPYGVPPDNPFADGAGGRPEVWAYGLRNPWRFSFDSATGNLWVGDVGQNAIEEIDIVRRGANYGWNIMEGTSCFEPRQGCDQTGLVLPVAEYRHDLGCSVSGGYVYRGARNPELAGVYLYADYCSGRIWGLRHDAGRAIENEELLRASFQIPSFGVDQNDEVYILGFDGGVYRFAATAPAPTPAPTAAPTPSPTPVPTPTTRSTPPAGSPQPMPTPPTTSLGSPTPGPTATATPPSTAPARPTSTPTPPAGGETGAADGMGAVALVVGVVGALLILGGAAAFLVRRR